MHKLMFMNHHASSAPWQVRGLVDFADANKDGKVDPKEVQSAIRMGKVSQKGGFFGPTKAEGYGGYRDTVIFVIPKYTQNTKQKS